MPVRVIFPAELVGYSYQPYTTKVPRRLRAELAICVRNPSTGRKLWLPSTAVTWPIEVNGRKVVAVDLTTRLSGRWRPVTAFHTELINPFTGNTFLVNNRFIKEFL